MIKHFGYNYLDMIVIKCFDKVDKWPKSTFSEDFFNFEVDQKAEPFYS